MDLNSHKSTSFLYNELYKTTTSIYLPASCETSVPLQLQCKPKEEAHVEDSDCQTDKRSQVRNLKLEADGSNSVGLQHYESCESQSYWRRHQTKQNKPVYRQTIISFNEFQIQVYQRRWAGLQYGKLIKRNYQFSNIIIKDSAMIKHIQKQLSVLQADEIMETSIHDLLSLKGEYAMKDGAEVREIMEERENKIQDTAEAWNTPDRQQDVALIRLEMLPWRNIVMGTDLTEDSTHYRINFDKLKEKEILPVAQEQDVEITAHVTVFTKKNIILKYIKGLLPLEEKMTEQIQTDPNIYSCNKIKENYITLEQLVKAESISVINQQENNIPQWGNDKHIHESFNETNTCKTCSENDRLEDALIPLQSIMDDVQQINNMQDEYILKLHKPLNAIHQQIPTCGQFSSEEVDKLYTILNKCFKLLEKHADKEKPLQDVTVQTESEINITTKINDEFSITTEPNQNYNDETEINKIISIEEIENQSYERQLLTYAQQNPPNIVESYDSVSNSPSQPEYSLLSECFDVIEEQNSSDDIIHFREYFINEIVGLEPDYDEQYLQKCESQQLLDIFNKSVLEKEGEVLRVLHQQQEEVINENTRLKKHMEYYELNMEEKSGDIKVLMTSFTELQRENEKLSMKLKEKDSSLSKMGHELEVLRNEQLHMKALKEELNLLTTKVQEVEMMESFSTEVRQMFNSAQELDDNSNTISFSDLFLEKINSVQTLSEELLQSRKQLSELNQKMNILKKHIDNLEINIQEKEDENHALTSNINILHKDKESLLLRVFKEMHNLETIEQEVQILRNELTVMKTLQKEVEILTEKHKQIQKLDVEIRKLFISLPELRSIQPYDMVQAIHLIIQRISMAQNLDEKNKHLNWQLAEMSQENNAMKKHIGCLELYIEEMSQEHKALMSKIDDLQKERDILMVQTDEKIQSFELLEKEFKILNCEQLNVQALKDKIKSKSQHIEKLELMNVEVQHIISPFLKNEKICDYDLLTSIHLLVQKVDNAQTFVKNFFTLKEKVSALDQNYNVMKTQIDSVFSNTEKKYQLNKELLTSLDNLEYLKGKVLQKFKEKEDGPNVLDHEQYTLPRIKGLHIKSEKLIEFHQLLASISDQETGSDIAECICLFGQKLKFNEDRIYDENKQLKKCIQSLEMDIDDKNQEYQLAVNRRLILENKIERMGDDILNLQIDKTYLLKHVDQLEKKNDEILKKQNQQEDSAYDLKNLEELEMTNREMKRLIASVPEFHSDNQDIGTKINIIIENLRRYNVNAVELLNLQKTLSDKEKETQMVSSCMKRQCKVLCKNKKKCVDLEMKIDELEEVKREQETKFRENIDVINNLQLDKNKLKTELKYISMKLNTVEKNLTKLGYKVVVGDDVIYQRNTQNVMSGLQQCTEEMEEQINELKMQLQQKNVENEGAFNLIHNLNKNSSKYEKKYNQLKQQMVQLQQMHCYVTKEKLKCFQDSCTLAVSVGVNTELTEECSKCVTLGRELRKLTSENFSHKAKISSLKLKIYCEDFTKKSEVKNLEKCLNVAQSKISELEAAVHEKETSSASMLMNTASSCDNSIQTGKEYVVQKHFCAEGSDLVVGERASQLTTVMNKHNLQ